MAGFPGLDELFEGRHFDREIIVSWVRWYLRFKLSFRDLVEMMRLVEDSPKSTHNGVAARTVIYNNVLAYRSAGS
jgi:transposase-like protein